MNSFKLYLDNTEIKNTVFPFRFGELLDERLDEAYVDFYGSDVEAFTPTTEARIEIYQDDKKVDTQYYIVANDNSQEYPIGSGKYKHSIYLLERTKLLDGVICSSLTFTNSSSKSYLPAGKRNEKVSYTTADDNDADFIYCAAPQNIFLDIEKNVHIGSKISLPSAYEVMSIFLDAYKNSNSGSQYHKYDLLEINKNGAYNTMCYTGSGLNQTPWKTPLKFTVKDVITKVTYQCVFSCYTDSSYSDYSEKYMAIHFELNGFEKKYALKKWTVTDCINRVLECAKPLFGGEEPEFVFDGVIYNNNSTIQSKYTGQAADYDRILAPEFSLSPGTLREQLKVIGSFIHAEPYLTYDDGKNILKFQPLGETKQCSLIDKPYVYSSAKTDINQYCTEVYTHAGNVVNTKGDNSNISEPSNSGYRSLRTEDTYARITENNGIVLTNYPIHSIVEVMCGILKNDGDYYIKPVDITPYIYESTEYYSLLSAYKENEAESRSYALHYTIGQKNIDGLFYTAPHKSNDVYTRFAIANILAKANKDKEGVTHIHNSIEANPGGLVFRVTYLPIYSIYAAHGKQRLSLTTRNYSQLYNQSENIIESEYFGENIKGVAARLGNTEEEKTYILKNFADIPNIGETLDEYAISAVNTEVMPSNIKCTLGLSKDFNRISEYVGVSNIKRMYEISERSVYERNVLIREFIVIGTRNTSPKKTLMLNIMKLSEIDCVKMQGYSQGHDLTSVVLPVLKTQVGNAISFTFFCKDNYSAGVTTKFKEEKDFNGRWQDDVKYTDDYGRVYWLNFELGRNNSNIDRAFMVPVALGLKFDSFIKTPQYLLLRKDNREKIKITYQIEAKTNNPNIIIYSEFMKLCKYLRSDAQDLLLIIFTKPYQFNKFDSNCYAGTNVADSIKFEANWIKEWTEGYGFSFSPSLQNKGFGWAIAIPAKEETFEVVDESGNLITQTVKTLGKMLIASTSTEKDEIIKLDFFMMRD